MGLFDTLKGYMGNIKNNTNNNSESIFGNLQIPAKTDFSKSYNQNVSNTGNFSLPVLNTTSEQATNKPIGDYSFTDDSSSYIPNTDFSNKITGLTIEDTSSPQRQNFDFNGGGGINMPNIDVTGFRYQNEQINPAQQLERNLYNYLLV